jgi:hypothetical protein
MVTDQGIQQYIELLPAQFVIHETKQFQLAVPTCQTLGCIVNAIGAERSL